MSTIYQGASEALEGLHFITGFEEILGILLKQTEFSKNSRTLKQASFDLHNVMPYSESRHLKLNFQANNNPGRVTGVNLADITCDTTSRLRLMTAVDTFSHLCQGCCALIGRHQVTRALIGRTHGGDLIGRLHY